MIPVEADSSELPWHSEQWKTLLGARSAGRLGHALLLSGPSGLGKRRFARRLADSLLCESSDSSSGNPCGACRSCKQLSANTQPNLKWITRKYDDKAKKLKRDISVEQVREMMESLALSSHYGGVRVVVIEPADALNLAGINALLKTMEEPPDGIHLVLVSERPMALAATLRSRCQRISFSTPPPNLASQWLEDRVPAEQIASALALSSGAPLAALSAYESGRIEQHRVWRKLWLDVAGRRLGPVEAAGRVAGSGTKLTPEFVQEWLQSFQRFLVDLLRVKSGVPVYEVPCLGMEVEGICNVQAELVDTLRRMASNPAPQLLLESLMISWWRQSSPRNTADGIHRA